MKPTHKTQIPAKVSRPRLASKVLLRKRLFCILKKGLSERAVWVTGPAGAGKTTFVNSYIDSNRVKTLWYQVDTSDRDPATFFLYAGMWLGAERKETAMPRFSPQASSHLSAFSKAYFREFFSELAGPVLVVFDNFQEASSCREFIEIVSAGVMLAPKGSTFVFISRSEPDPVLAGAHGGPLAKIGWDDIRLTEGESLEIARLHGAGLDRHGIERIYAKTDGWMAGLVLLVEQARAGLESVEAAEGSSTISFDYFMSEVFDKIDHCTQGLLLKSALFEDITPRMAAGISGVDKAADILDSMSTGNFFVARRSSGLGVSYQFHPLFRDFLIERARRVFSQDELGRLMVRAAGLSLEAGQVDWAAGLYIKARDWAGLGRLLHEHAPSFMAQGRLKALHEILKKMPEDILQGAPWLLYYYGLCRLSESPAGARESFEAAYALFRSANDSKGLFQSLTGVIDTILYEWKDFKPLDRWIPEFEGLIRRYGAFPIKEIEVAATTCIFSAMMFRQPDNPGLPAWEERVRALVDAAPDNAARISITRNLILYYIWTGKADKAGDLVKRLRPASNEALRDPLAQLMWLRSAALYRALDCSGREVFDLIEYGLALADKTGIHLLDNLFFGVGIYCSIAVSDLAKAEEFLERMRQGLDSEKCVGISYYNHHAAIIAWHKGRLNEAIEHAGLSLELITLSGARINVVIYESLFLFLLIEAERFDGVESRINAMRDYGRSFGSHMHESLGLLAEAYMSFKKGDSSAFARSFKRSVGIFKEQRIHSIGSLFTPAALAKLCAKALELGIETEFVNKIIRLNHLYKYPPDPALQEWPWEVKVYSFGMFGIFSDGVKTEPSRKAQTRPLSMLAHLVSAGGRPVAEEALQDALWPASEGDHACKSFNTTVHRLRKLLGSERALRNVDGMLWLDSAYVWVDAWALEHLLDRAVASCGEEMEGALEKALGIYRRGEYCAGEVHHSIISRRERLKARLIEGLERAGAVYEQTGDLEKALKIYLDGIESDALAENLYRRAMACHIAMGHRPEALKIYERLKSVLGERLGIKPSLETEELYRTAAK